MNDKMHEPIIEVSRLARSFGEKEALQGLSFTVQPGQVFGLVGENGAGKTTLIRHLLGAYQAETGAVRVFGHDPVANPVAVLSQVGYLSEDRDLPLWMRVGELMAYTAAFYPGWDESYAEEMRQRFALPKEAKIRQLSRGEKAKAGLLAALGHRPPLLILDEPSSGLDAVARKDILGAVVRSVAEEGRTVLFSSHLLDEVERVADHILMMHHGTAALDMPMDELRARHHRFIVRFDDGCTEFPALPGLLYAEGEGKEWNILCTGEEKSLTSAIAQTGGAIVEAASPSLDAIFVARVTGERNNMAAA